MHCEERERESRQGREREEARKREEEEEVYVVSGDRKDLVLSPVI